MIKNIRQIREEFEAAGEEELVSLFEFYGSDERKGVQKLILSKKKQIRALKEERIRIEKLCRYEEKYGNRGLVCGIDEVGRGPLAGPVVACAVILPKDCRILYVNDSKKLSPSKREELSEIIKARAVSFGLGLVSPARIDEINILQATYEAMREAVSGLDPAPDILLNDAVTIPGLPFPQVPIVGGDGKSISIASASIVAKVHRDRLMEDYDRIFPGYGFASNKGYGTREHMRAIRELGPCPIHRKTFIGGISAEDADFRTGMTKKETGRKGEHAAAAWLEERGVRILERNFRSRFGEIDLIGTDGHYIIVFEVKTRKYTGAGPGSAAVDIQKQRKICKTFDYYRCINRINDERPVRFDVVEVDDRFACRWIRNAFDYLL